MDCGEGDDVDREIEREIEEDARRAAGQRQPPRTSVLNSESEGSESDTDDDCEDAPRAEIGLVKHQFSVADGDQSNQL